MKRLNLLMAMLLMVLAGAWGQTSQRAVHRVQGIERADLTVPQVMNRASANGTGIDLDSIQAWVGDEDCENRAAFAVKWHDGSGYTDVYVWGYRYDGAKTGADMIAEIAKEDPRFYYLVYGGTWSYTDSTQTDSIYTGDAIGGIGYCPSNYQSISLKLNGVTQPMIQGAAHTNAYNFDDWTSGASSGYWNSGWYSNGYWSYWNADSVNLSYGYASTGCSGRTLTNGCVDGWSFAYKMTWYPTMNGNIIYVPAIPTNGQNAPSQSPQRVETRTANEGTVHTVTTLQELVSAVSSASSGDIVQFDESLRGQEMDGSGMSDKITIKGKEVNIYGNGVILKNFVGIKFGSEGKGIIKDFIFDNPQGTVIVSNARGFATVDNCIFRNYIDGNDNLIKAVYTSKYDSHDYYLTIKNCLFENNTLRNVNYNYFGPMIELGGYVKSEHDFTATFVNNTFRGNITNNPICIKTGNKIDLVLINNVFEENKNKGGSIDINIGENTYLTSAYNVISGGINDVYQSQLSETDKWAVDLEASLENVDGQWQVKKGSPAYHNVPAEAIVFDEDGCPTLMGVKLPTTDIYGNAIDYTKPLQAGCSQMVVGGDLEEPQAIDYTQGTFLLNEDWYGHQNSTINFLTEEGEMIYRVIQRENEGGQLGCTAQYGTIYGGKMYITSKQEKDPGAKVTGGRLTICDARTMKVEKQFQTITANGYKGKADGRAFVGVNEHKGYMGTSNGIFILDLDELEFTDYIKVPNDDEDLYTGQVGNMVRAGDYVFANHQNAGLLVIDPETDQIVKTLKPNDALVSTMTLANDGNLWLMSGGKLVKLDPYSLEMTTVELPSNVKTTSEGWGAWRASTFCASRQQNALFWVSYNSDIDDKGDVIIKYDIDKGEVSHYLQLPEAEEWSIYGSGFRIDPVTDEAIMCLFKTYGNNSYITRKYNAQGEKILELEMEKNYWFPALPIYPDNAAPMVTPLEAQTVALGETLEVSLANLATDADNMTASIVKTVKAVSDSEVLTASIKGGKLLLEGLTEGTATVTIQINSNGQLAETEVSVEVITIPATGVTLDAEEIALFPGETATLTATVVPENATDKTLTWTSSNEEIATVDAEGTVTAVAVGEATITATCGTLTATCTVTVKSEVASFEDLELAAESYWAGDEDGEDWMDEMGYYAQIKSGAYSFDNYYVPDWMYWFGYGISNRTSTEYKALTDQYNSCVGSGVNGSANYLVAYPDGSMWGENPMIRVNGEAKVVPGFYITNTAWVVDAIVNGDGQTEGTFTAGDYFKITIHALDAEGNETAKRDFCLADYRFENEGDRYYVKDWTYVDLSQLGEAAAFTFTFDGSRGNAWGLTTPTYFCIDDFGAEGEENVREEGTFDGKVTSIMLNVEELTLTVGETATITATVEPDNAIDKTVTWTSSDEAVATVDAAGTVTAVTAGVATITATCGEVTATCTVIVNEPDGINAISISSCDVIFTLDGKRVNTITNKGIYIINGKKTMVK